MTSKSEQKELTHQAILESASRAVRERGIVGTRVADVMQAAQLTVGGFYRHFGSKAELVDEALRQTGAKLRQRIFAHIADKPAADRVVVLLKRYLSPAHRDLQTDGCPLPAVVGEIGTAAPEHRAVLAGEVEALAGGLSEHLIGSGTASLSRRQLALGLVALMYGGLSLARALRGSELSDEMLKACRAIGAVVAGGPANATAGGQEAARR
jgi:TetR/AcrR family transcriptional regulator, transcriptional repressor for nem operon